jgi:hypothetical protein
MGGDPDLVSDLASSQVMGYHAGGISTVAKHFPGTSGSPEALVVAGERGARSTVTVQSAWVSSSGAARGTSRPGPERRASRCREGRHS